MKSILKNVASLIWLIVTPVVLVIVIVANFLLSVTFYEAVSTRFGRASVKMIDENTSYEADFESKKAAYDNGNEVSRRICEEGFTLLKNEGAALPLAQDETKVCVFGKNSVSISTAGSGSAGKAAADTDIFKSLTDAGFTYNQALVDFYKDNTKSGSGRTTNPDDLDSGKEVTLSEGETPVANYDAYNIWDTCAGYSDVAIIVVTRIGGEGFDLPRSADGSHFLQLQKNERDLIDKVTQMNFKKVVLVLNTATTMELGEVDQNSGIDAILWTGYAGGNGMAAFGEILRGETAEGQKFSPSGKTVDTYAADFTHSPVWENMGAALGGDAYTTSTTSLITGQSVVNREAVYFVDYEEGIYVGYRYYETAYAEALKGNYDFDYDAEVVYPFGYGLSYTTFEWELVNRADIATVLGEKTAVTFQVKVTNSGNYPGRDVVQIYVTPPYTAGGIEKSAKVLVGFAKTNTLQPGESETVEITVDSPYEFASYDYSDANKNGFKGYEIEKGAYTFAVSTDAHTSVFDVNATVEDDIRYEKDPVTGNAVENLYTDNADETLNSDYELGSVLSRADFAGTWPARRTEEEKNRNNQKDWLVEMQSEISAPNRPEGEDEMPVTGANFGISFSDLVGLDYNDDLWNKFMDQLTVSEMTSLINNGAFHTEAIARLGVPPTTSSDGAFGYVNFIGDSTVYGTCVYPCAVVVASTWNVERAYEFGLAIGNEGLVGNEVGDGAPYTGIYAPGLNIHRSPFGGRNCEYYSEDGLIGGMMAASYAEGCAQKGVYVTFKHFALNDQETHRSVSGLLTWATEQSMREIYLKSFEVAVKTAASEGVKAMGIMSSFNRIGMRWTGGDYRLLTNILREEWGYRGLVISDFNTCSHMVDKDMFYAGGDMDLQILGIQWSPDKNNATDVTVARNAAKNILYVVANTNAVRGSFKIIMPTWQIVMFVVDGAIVALLAVWGAAVIVRAVKKDRAQTA